MENIQKFFILTQIRSPMINPNLIRISSESWFNLSKSPQFKLTNQRRHWTPAKTIQTKYIIIICSTPSSCGLSWNWRQIIQLSCSMNNIISCIQWRWKLKCTGIATPADKFCWKTLTFSTEYRFSGWIKYGKFHTYRFISIHKPVDKIKSKNNDSLQAKAYC